MKQLFCFLVVLALSFGLCACSGEEPAAQGNSIPAGVTSSENERGENPSLDTSNKDVQENPNLTAVGMPPLPENLQLMYQGAEEMVRAFTLCAFQTDSSSLTIEGMDYHPIVDMRFPTYTKLKEYLLQYFTEDFVNEQLLTSNGCVRQAEDDVPVVIAASGAEDATYAGHVFRIDSKTDTKIVFTATAYFAEDTYLENYFFTAPQNADGFTVKDFTYQLDYTQNGWRFSKFPFMRG